MIGIAVKEPIATFGLTVTAVKVPLSRIAHEETGVEEEPRTLLLRPTPCLHERLVAERRIRAHSRNARIDQRLAVRTLDTPRESIVVDVLQAEVEETVSRQGEACVDADLETIFTIVVLAELQLDLRAFAGILHFEIDHAGDRIRSVPGSGTIAQNLDTLDSNTGDHADVDAMSTKTVESPRRWSEGRTGPPYLIATARDTSRRTGV